tara:strand:+ start:1059 stop:1226 length:168 start_codon:yes stop_codon:yes gene_type:complete
MKIYGIILIILSFLYKKRKKLRLLKIKIIKGISARFIKEFFVIKDIKSKVKKISG